MLEKIACAVTACLVFLLFGVLVGWLARSFEWGLLAGVFLCSFVASGIAVWLVWSELNDEDK